MLCVFFNLRKKKHILFAFSILLFYLCSVKKKLLLHIKKTNSMKQVLIRILPGVATVYDVVYGHIVDGQFVTSPIDDCEFPIPPFVHCSSLLGGTSYIEASDLFSFIHFYDVRSSNIEFYPNMLVFNLDTLDSDEPKEGTEEE